MTYTLESRIQYWLFVVGIPIFALATSFGIVWIRLHDSEGNTGIGWAAIALWFGALAWGLYRQSVIPHTIELTNTGTIRFVGTFRTSEIPSSNVISVRV